MNRKQVATGIGEIEAVQIVFIILKLCGLIHWSWFWVLSPTIFYFAILLVLVLIVLIVNKIRYR